MCFSRGALRRLTNITSSNTLDSTLPTGRLFHFSEVFAISAFCLFCFMHITFVFLSFDSSRDHHLPSPALCLTTSLPLAPLPPSLLHPLDRPCQTLQAFQLKSPMFLLQPPQLSRLSKPQLSLLPSTCSCQINPLTSPSLLSASESLTYLHKP